MSQGEVLGQTRGISGLALSKDSGRIVIKHFLILIILLSFDAAV